VVRLTHGHIRTLRGGTASFLDSVVTRPYSPSMRHWVALLAIVILTGCTESPQPTPSSSAATPIISSPGTTTSAEPTPSSATTVHVPEPGQVVAAFGSLWVESHKDGTVWRIGSNGDVAAQIADSTSSRTDQRFTARSTAITAGFGSVWTLTDDALVRIDPASNKVAGRVPIAVPNALAVGEGAVWVVSGPGQIRLIKIDPSTMRADNFADLGTSVGAIAVSAGYVWLVRFSEAGGMDRIDPTSGALSDLPVGYNDRFLVATPRWLWLINTGSAQSIDPTDGRAVDARPKKKASGSIGASYSHGVVWINDGAAVGIDARSGALVERILAFTGVKWWWTGGIAQLRRRVWLADPAGDRVVGLPLD